MEIIIGSHVSFKKDTELLGSVLEASTYGANTFMIYTGAPQNTTRYPIDSNLTKKADEEMKKNNIHQNHIIAHAPYIINLANPKNMDFGISFLKQEIKRVESLGIGKLVLHPGSSVGLEEKVAINNIINALNEVLNIDTKVIICLETMAGKGTEIGKNLSQLKEIIDGVKYPLMVCLDTCHLHDAGYDMSDFDQFLNEFDQIIGISKIGCIHINDSKNERNSHKDRHENIGYGYIGFDNLIHIIYHEKLKEVPKILETPYVKDLENKKLSFPPYKFEIEMIKNKKMNQNLMEDIRKFYISSDK